MIKKFIIFCICLNLASSTLFASPLIVDEFVEETLDEVPIERYDNSKNLVEDEIVKKFIPVSAKKNSKVLSLGLKQDNIIDDTAKNIDRKKIKPIKDKTKYNYALSAIPIQLRVTKNLTTKHDGVREGDLILFKMIKPANLGKNILPKGTEIVGRVETVSPNDLLGSPADLVVENFIVKDNEKINLYGTIKKRGANRSWWLYPIYQAGNIAFWAAGYPLVLVRGGHAKLSTKEVYTIYYEIQ